VKANDLARRVAETMRAAEGMGPAWDIVLEEARVGYARVRMAIRPDMLNGFGTAHGGMTFAVADTAFAYACNSRNEKTIGQQASMIFLGPAYEGDTLVAEAREDARVGRSAAYTVDVRTTNGRVIAIFQGQSRVIGGAIVSIEEID